MTDHAKFDKPSNPAPSNLAGVGNFPDPGQPVFHGFNPVGLWTLYMKEVRRFFKVQLQTIWAPSITTLLYLVIFTLAITGGGSNGAAHTVLGVSYASFLAPGLIAMGMLNNAFANASFGLLVGKMQGTIVDYLMPPISDLELMLALVAAAVTRAVLVGLAIYAAMFLWPGVDVSIHHPWAVVWFGLMGATLFALIGVLTSLWADKFDHNAAVTNFVIAPMAMLSGTFYVVTRLAPTFRTISEFNPVFYVISGFRFGFLGQSDIGATNDAVIVAALGLGALNAALALITYMILRSGWKLRS